MEIKNIGYIIIFVFLIICALQDLHEESINILIIIIFLVIGVGIKIYEEGIHITSFTGILVGAMLLILSILTNNMIGIGDGLIFLVIGVYMGFWNNLQILFFSCILATLFGTVLIILRKWDKKSKFPFAPFIFMGNLIVLIST